MDIRSIIESDPPASAQSRLAKQGQKQPERIFQGAFEVPPATRNPHGGTRPPQPPPIQPPLQPQSHIELPSPGLSSYASAQSPYQQTPSSSLSGGQYPFPQALSLSPGHGFKPSPYAHQENHTNLIGGYGPSPPMPLTPLHIAHDSSQVYSHQPRQNSTHSLTTPTSAHSQLSNFPKVSPQTLQPQIRASSQSHATQHYHSQPGTPLGPPPTYGRPTPNLHREPSGSFEHSRNHSGSSHGYQQVLASSPRTGLPGSSAGSPRDSEPRRLHPNTHPISNHGDRERTLSVSPKTKLPAQSQGKFIPVPLQPTQAWNAQVIPAKRKLGPDSLADHLPQERTLDQGPVRSHSLGVNGLLNAPNPSNSSNDLREPSPKRQNMVTLAPTVTSEANSVLENYGQQNPLEMLSTRPPAETQPIHQPLESHTQGLQQSSSFHVGSRPLMPVNMAHTSASSKASQDSTVPQPPSSHTNADKASFNPPPAKKKQRPTETPIYAQSSRTGSRFVSGNPVLRNSNRLGGKPVASMKKESGGSAAISSLAPVYPATSAMGKHEAKQEANGHALPGNLDPLPKTQPVFAEPGPLGPWEPSIVNVIPSEEIIRVISDYLFNEVVRREDVGAGPAGGGGCEGAVLEIEAKIGQLIDKHTNERLRLPVMSECVINSRDTSLRVSFKSSMTEAQHRALNGFLNAALINSQPPKSQPGSTQPADRPRIPMSYVHTYETDSFFELSQSGALSLPASIRAQLNPRHPKAKVRVTTDQKTNKEIARIVKARVADLDVYSPCTPFDWRVSVNIEMNFEGDLKLMTEPSPMDGKRPERNKDRMSYRHLAYQIDLTQVTPAEATSKTEKEHELEIEVSSAEVRKQGSLAKEGLPNEYEKLIRGFVDNVRLLARQCQ